MSTNSLSFSHIVWILNNFSFLGLVFFKETSDTGYALMCGPGGNHDPPLGNLEGFCNDVRLFKLAELGIQEICF